MKNAILLLAGLVLGSVTYAQVTYYAPDLRWDDQLRAYLGIANPSLEPVAVTVSGFAENGAPLGRITVALPKLGRWEAASEDLLSGRTPAWVQIDADIPLTGYVRYRSPDGERSSLVPLNRVSGQEVLQAHVQPFGQDEVQEFVLVNTGPRLGQAFLQGSVLGRFDSERHLRAESTPLPGFGAPGSKILFNYSDHFTQDRLELFWGRVLSDGLADLSGIRHMGSTQATSTLATTTLPRTTFREMIITPFHTDERDYRSEFVLANTFPTELQIELTAFYRHRSPQTLVLALEPFEQQLFGFNDLSTINLNNNALWYRLRPLEGGVVGFQRTLSRDGRALAATQALKRPGSTLALPYTPSNDQTRTTIGMVNPTDEILRVTVAGLNDAGDILALKTALGLDPYQKRTFSAEDLFGEAAAQISWARIHMNRGDLMAYALVEDRDGRSMAALEAMPINAKGGDLFTADFEFFRVKDLVSQGWSGKYFKEDFRRSRFQKNGAEHFFFDYLEIPKQGQFYTEKFFVSQTESLYLGYSPLYTALNQPPPISGDAAALLSPFFEVPDFGDYFLSFYMRFMNPIQATKSSRYGMIYRQEGSTQWYWLGVRGNLLTGPFGIGGVRDEYSYYGRFVEVTEWFPFEIKIPDSFHGKRMQVGMYYFHQPEDSPVVGPHIFIDRVRVSGNPLPYSLFYGEDSAGTFFEN